MIIINRKPSIFHRREGNQDNSLYYVTGLVNWNVVSRPNLFHPPTDVLETDEKVIVRIEIAGIESEHFSINFDQHFLSVEGNRKDPLVRRTFHQMEVQFGDFSSIVEVLIPIASDLISAEYMDGFLIIDLPKLKATTIQVEDEE